MTNPDDVAVLRGAQAVSLEAQAKVNLRLRVLARETSGYHQIETLFLRLALADTVRVRRTAGARSLDVSFEGRPYDLGPVEENLAWRAAASYFDASGMRGGFAIEIAKRIPVGGGMGGGSADAGAVLRALDAIADESVGDAMLLSLAERLGADVPFLTTTHAYALAWGRGERMLALEPPKATGVWVVVPPIGVNTAEAYGWLAAQRAGQPDRPADPTVLDVASLSDWDAIAGNARNDFEPVVFSRLPALRDRVAALRAFGFRIAMLSGSGSAMFGVHLRGDREIVTVGQAANPDADRDIVTQTAVRVERPFRIE